MQTAMKQEHFSESSACVEREIAATIDRVMKSSRMSTRTSPRSPMPESASTDSNRLDVSTESASTVESAELDVSASTVESEELDVSVESAECVESLSSISPLKRISDAAKSVSVGASRLCCVFRSREFAANLNRDFEEFGGS